MSLITISVELPDDYEFIVDYGTEDAASLFLEHGSGWLFAGHYRLVSWEGPNDPLLCGACGDDFHPRGECDRVEFREYITEVLPS